jgi:hypothetical protein
MLVNDIFNISPKLIAVYSLMPRRIPNSRQWLAKGVKNCENMRKTDADNETRI